MRAKRRTRNDWLAAALRAMAKGGVDAVRVEPLARSLGVTKGSFYWHFRDRNALLEATLDVWEEGGTDRIVRRAEEAGGDALARLLRVWELTADRGRIAAELAIRDWARREPAVAARVRRVDRRRLEYLRQLLREAKVPDAEIEARALLLKSLLIGSYFIHASHRGRARARVVREAIEIALGAGGAARHA